MIKKLIFILTVVDLFLLSVFNAVFVLSWQFLFVIIAFTIFALISIYFYSSEKTFFLTVDEFFLVLAMMLLPIFSYYRFVSFVDAGILLSGFFFYLAVSRVLSDLEKRNLLIIIVVLGIFEALFGFTVYIVCAISPHSSLANYFVSHSFISATRVSSFFQYPNAFAGFLLMPFFILIYFLSVSKTKFTRVVFVLTASFLLFILYLTSSRGAYIVLIISMLVLLVLENGNERKRIFLQLLSIFTISLFFYFLNYKLFYPSIAANFERTKILLKFFAGESNRSLYDRIQLAKDAVQIFLHHPFFGTGLGTFKDAMLKYRTDLFFAKEPHSLPFRMLAETGMVGFTTLFLFICKKTLHGLKKSPLIFISLIALLLHTFLDLDFAYPLISSLLFIGFGIVSSSKRGRFNLQIASKKMLYVSILGIAVIISILVPNFVSAMYLASGNSALQKGNIKVAISSYTVSLKLQPGDSKAHAQLAYAYEKLAYLKKENCESYIDNAIFEYQKASNTNKLSFIYPLYEGRLLLLKKDSRSVALCERSFDLNPLWKPLLSDIALSEAYTGVDVKDSINLAHEALEFKAPKEAYESLGYTTAKKKDSDAYTALGYALLKTDYFDKALSLNPQNGFAYLGKYFTENNNLLKLEDLRKSVMANPCIMEAKKLYFAIAPLIKVESVNLEKNGKMEIKITVLRNAQFLKEFKVFATNGESTIFIKSFSADEDLLLFSIPDQLKKFRIKIEGIDKNGFAISGIISPEFDVSR